MQVDRHALEIVFRTLGERFQEHPFKSSLYPRGMPNYPFDVRWNGIAEETRPDFQEIDRIFTAAIHDSVDDYASDSIGVMLSGGIDSAPLLYLLRREYPNADITAYHTDWGESFEERIELKGAKRSAQFADAPLRVIDAGIIAQLPYVEDALKETLSINYSVTIFYLAFHFLAREGIDVALLGDGLDSFFGGGGFNKVFYLRSRYKLIPFFQDLIGFEPYVVASKLFGTHKAWFVSMISRQPHQLVRESGFSFDDLYNRLKRASLWDLVQEWNVSNTSYSASVIARAAWAQNIEIKYPFIVQNIVDLSAQFGPEMNVNKNIIRNYMRSLGFPEVIVQTGNRWDKKGWGATSSPYFTDAYMNRVTPRNPDLEYWFTEKGKEIYLRTRRLASATGYLMHLFLKIIQLHDSK